jgi:hypothetical protein
MPRQPLRHTHRRASTNEQSLAASQDHLPVNHMGVGGSNRAVCSSKDSAGDDQGSNRGWQGGGDVPRTLDEVTRELCGA